MTRQKNALCCLGKKVTLSKKYKSHNTSQREKKQFSHCFYRNENIFFSYTKPTMKQNTKPTCGSLDIQAQQAYDFDARRVK